MGDTCALMSHDSAGLLLIHEKEYVGALELFQRLSQLDPGNSAVRQQVANLLKHLDRNKQATVTSSPPSASQSRHG